MLNLLTQFQKQPGLRWTLSLNLVFSAFLLTPRVQENPILFKTFVLISICGFLWNILLAHQIQNSGIQLKLTPYLLKSHYIQALVQLSIFVFWSTYWKPVHQMADLIFAQLLFGYLLESLVYFSRQGQYRLGFGLFPLIFSINLFLWFKEDWFYFQFLLVATAILGKIYVTWMRGGNRRHIFNPSGIALSLFSLGLILTNSTSEVSWAIPIATELYHPMIFIVLFGLGLVVEYFFSITLMTFMATAALFILDSLYFQMTGSYWFIDSNIPPAVFLGIHLLITDPATSPKTNMGKIIFGLLYGSGVFILFWLLESVGQPTLYDKILCVPLLNLMVPGIDAICRRIKLPQHKILSSNLLHMGLWGTFFIYLVYSNFLGSTHPGTNVSFWEKSCYEKNPNACKSFLDILHRECRRDNSGACNQIGAVLKLQPHLNIHVTTGMGFHDYFGQACSMESDAGCANYLNEILFSAKLPKEPHLTNAIKSVEKQCIQEKGKECYLIGISHYRGVKTPLNKTSAAAYFERACEYKFEIACGKVGHMYLTQDGIPGNFDKAAKSFQRACDLGDASSCSYLGAMYQYGDGVEKDEKKSKKLITKACDMGLGEACSWLQNQD